MYKFTTKAVRAKIFVGFIERGIKYEDGFTGKFGTAFIKRK